MLTRPELDRIIRRAKDDLNALDVAIKKKENVRSALEAELDALIEKRDNWGNDDGA